MKIQGTKGMHTFNIPAFKGMLKETFLKKYKGKLVDIDKVWDKIQAELKSTKKAEVKKEDQKPGK